jgi:hypothetical protein
VKRNRNNHLSHHIKPLVGVAQNLAKDRSDCFVIPVFKAVNSWTKGIVFKICGGPKAIDVSQGVMVTLLANS